MLGRLAATALAAALFAPAAQAAPQALRGPIAAEAAGSTEPSPDTAAPSPRRARAARRRHAPAQDAPALVAVPANGAPVVVERPASPRRSRATKAPAVATAAPGEVVEAVPEAPSPRASRRRTRTRVAALPAATAVVETPEVGDVVEPAPRRTRTSRRRGRTVLVEGVTPGSGSGRADLDARIEAHAKAAGVPAELVHRVIIRESRYNPGAVGRGGVYGLMQIKHGTARALGYNGAPSGLLDPDTNLRYGVRYLAGAYKVANGNQSRAYSYFRSGYYYAAKRAGGRQLEYPALAEAPAQTGSVSSRGGLGSALSQIFSSPAASAR